MSGCSVADSQPIPFQQGLASGLDQLSGAQPTFENFLPDAAGALRQWPGVRTWSDFPGAPAASPVIGMFHWRSWLIFILQNRSVYALEDNGTVLDLSYALGGSGRPVFTYDQTRVAFVGGGAPGQWQGAGPATDLAPGATLPSGSPLALTSIAYIAQRFIGASNDLSGFLVWTPPGAGNHTSWPIVGPYFAEAEGAPDPIAIALANSNELFAIGTETTQTYSPDPDIGFSIASSIAVGVATDSTGYGAFTVIETEDGNLSWLDNNRRFVQSNGRSADVISSPGMAATAKSLTTISDGWGCNIMLGSHDLLVWCFPTEKRCFWYDKITKKWGERSSLDANGDNQSWIAQSYFYWAERNLHLVGLSDGTIGELTFDAATDNGLPIKAVSETGFQDHGTFLRKINERVYLQFRRGGTAPPATAPTVTLRYRDDLGAWKVAKSISMGAANYQPTVPTDCLGEYRQRQWRIEWTGGSDFLLAGASEQFRTGDT